MIHNENDLLTDDELVADRDLLKKLKPCMPIYVK